MRTRRTRDQIRKLLQQLDRERAKGLRVDQVCRKFGITEKSYYRWRALYGPEVGDDARRVRELEDEVRRLKQLVADLALDKQLLQEVAKKKW